jgi:hypothetical protein
MLAAERNEQFATTATPPDIRSLTQLYAAAAGRVYGHVPLSFGAPAWRACIAVRPLQAALCWLIGPASKAKLADSLWFVVAAARPAQLPGLFRELTRDTLIAAWLGDLHDIFQPEWWHQHGLTEGGESDAAVARCFVLAFLKLLCFLDRDAAGHGSASLWHSHPLGTALLGLALSPSMGRGEPQLACTDETIPLMHQLLAECLPFYTYWPAIESTRHYATHSSGIAANGNINSTASGNSDDARRECLRICLQVLGGLMDRVLNEAFDQHLAIRAARRFLMATCHLTPPCDDSPAFSCWPAERCACPDNPDGALFHHLRDHLLAHRSDLYWLLLAALSKHADLLWLAVKEPVVFGEAQDYSARWIRRLPAQWIAVYLGRRGSSCRLFIDAVKEGRCDVLDAIAALPEERALCATCGTSWRTRPPSCSAAHGGKLYHTAVRHRAAAEWLFDRAPWGRSTAVGLILGIRLGRSDDALDIIRQHKSLAEHAATTKSGRARSHHAGHFGMGGSLLLARRGGVPHAGASREGAVRARKDAASARALHVPH